MTTNKPGATRYVACQKSLNGVSEVSDKTGGWLRRYVSEMDYEALKAECADMERDYLAIIEAQDAEHRKQTVKLQTECEKLRKLATECADYLDTNDMTSISHGSILHRKLLDAAMQGDQP